MKKVVVIDNYDSFTYNLVHYVEAISDVTPVVLRNDEINETFIEDSDYLILSPGPGLPKESGKLMDIIQKYHSRKKILGVCLGQQAIGEFFGGKLKNLNEVLHGVQTEISKTNEDILLKGLPEKFNVGRYHSWVIEKESLPQELIITSEDINGEIMSIAHKSLPIKGVQFHPESIMTDFGIKIIENFLKI